MLKELYSLMVCRETSSNDVIIILHIILAFETLPKSSKYSRVSDPDPHKFADPDPGKKVRK